MCGSDVHWVSFVEFLPEFVRVVFSVFAKTWRWWGGRQGQGATAP